MKRTPPSNCCRRTFAANAVRLQLHALAYNLGNFMRTLAMSKATKCAPSTASSIDAAMLEFGETHQSRSDFPLPGRAGLGYSAAAATASGTRFGAGVSRTPTAETIAASTAKPASA